MSAGPPDGLSIEAPSEEDRAVVLPGLVVGRQLRAPFEEAGRARGCVAVWLDTFSFQAKPSYLSQGYHEFGELPGDPNWHTRPFMWKRFDGGAEVDG